MKLQPKRGFVAQLDSNQNRDRKAENFGNMVKDYEAKASYVISWKSDSLKKRYEKVVGQGADNVVAGNNTNAIYSKLKGKNVLGTGDYKQPSSSRRPKEHSRNQARCRCSTQPRDRRRGSTLAKTPTQNEGLVASNQTAELKLTLNKRRLHPRSKNAHNSQV